MHDNWWGWLGVIIMLVIVQAWRALFRAGKGPSSGMARLNAAAERILKERSASAANPTPHSKPASAGKVAAAARSAAAAKTGAKRHSHAPLPKSTTPAVIRRNGILSGAREPVIQRRR